MAIYSQGRLSAQPRFEARDPVYVATRRDMRRKVVKKAKEDCRSDIQVATVLAVNAVPAGMLMNAVLCGGQMGAADVFSQLAGGSVAALVASNVAAKFFRWRHRYPVKARLQDMNQAFDSAEKQDKQTQLRHKSA